MNYDIPDSKLINDVKEFVKSKIKGVKNVEDIFLMSNFIVPEDGKETNTKLDDELYRFQRILQLSVNSYNNFEDSRSNCVKFDFSPSEPLHKFYARDETTNLWRCVSRPTEDHLVTSLFNYVVCYLRNKRKNKSPKKPIILKCPFCEEDLQEGAIKCEICETSVEDMLSVKDYLESRDVVDREEVVTAAAVTALEAEVPPVKEEVKESTPKWNCSICRFQNDYTKKKCTFCNEAIEEGWWKCEKCEFESTCRKSVCDNCQTKNVTLSRQGKTEDITAVVTVDVSGDRWLCTKCGWQSPFAETVCDACSSARTVSGRWACAKCTFLNQMAATVCEVCQAPSARVATPPGDDRGRWRCTYLPCKLWNVGSDQFCQHCHLDRHFSHSRGDAVRVADSAGPRSIWICHKCFAKNDLKDVKCAVCTGMRHEMKYCYHCHDYRNGALNHCDKCHGRL